jgi:hypothetical protein
MPRLPPGHRGNHPLQDYLLIIHLTE